MTIKLDCPCGQRVAFDVEPEDGRMPMSIPCPACAADLTELANQFIARQAPPAPTPVRVAVRVSTPAAAAEGESAPPLTARAAALQRAQIMAQTAAPEKGTPEEETPRISTDEGGKLFRLLKLALAGVGVLIVAWAWFAFVAAKPKVRFTLETPESVPFRHVQWLDDERVFLLTDGKAAVRNLKSDQEAWSQPLAKDEAPTSGVEDFGSSARPPLVRVVAGDFWVALENKLVRFDGATGKREASVPLNGRVEAITADAAAIVAVTETTPSQRLVTRVELISGKATTETVTLGPARSPVASPASEDGDFFSDKPAVRTEFTPSGSGVAALSIRLLERRFITREGVSTVSQGERDAMPVIDRPNLRAMDSTDAARQFLGQTGGGPVEYDESRHAVTLRRLFGGAGQWSGEVVGEPVLFATASADLLVAGTDLRAFDRNCKLLWSVKLSYPASPKALAGNPPPVVETGSRLFFFDLGTLTAIEAASGKVAWRLPTVGIKQVVPGPAGALYVSTTSAGPEAIKPTEGSGGLDLNNRAHPVLLKVEAASGRVLWQLDRVADQVWPSGKFLYAGRTGVEGLAQMTAAMNGEDAREMFHLRRLDPDNGLELWVWRQSGAPRHFTARDNRLLVLNPRELKLLRFASF